MSAVQFSRVNSGVTELLNQSSPNFLHNIAISSPLLMLSTIFQIVVERQRKKWKWYQDLSSSHICLYRLWNLVKLHSVLSKIMINMPFPHFFHTGTQMNQVIKILARSSPNFYTMQASSLRCQLARRRFDILIHFGTLARQIKASRPIWPKNWLPWKRPLSYQKKWVSSMSFNLIPTIWWKKTWKSVW